MFLAMPEVGFFEALIMTGALVWITWRYFKLSRQAEQ
jgi:hypothetical protein